MQQRDANTGSTFWLGKSELMLFFFKIKKSLFNIFLLVFEISRSHSSQTYCTHPDFAPRLEYRALQKSILTVKSCLPWFLSDYVIIIPFYTAYRNTSLPLLHLFPLTSLHLSNLSIPVMSDLSGHYGSALHFLKRRHHPLGSRVGIYIPWQSFPLHLL